MNNNINRELTCALQESLPLFQFVLRKEGLPDAAVGGSRTKGFVGKPLVILIQLKTFGQVS